MGILNKNFNLKIFQPLGCTSSPTNFNSFEKGCYSVTKEFVMDHAKYIGGAGIAVALLMVS